MTAAELLERLEPLTHGERVTAMIALGRQSDTESREIIGQLEQGNMYERMLALYSCFGSRDSAHALRALDDPSRLIRGLATRLAALLCDESALLGALQSVAGAVRPPLLARMRQRGHLTAIDRYLDLPATQADVHFYALLPFGSPETVGRFMPEFTDQATLGHWRALARLHPTLVLAHLLRQANAATEWDGPLLARVNALLPVLAKVNALLTADLLRALARTVDPNRISLDKVINQAPRTVADLYLAHIPEGYSRVRWSGHVVTRLTNEQIIAIYQRTPNALEWGHTSWFRLLAPDRRTAVFAACKLNLRQNGFISESILAQLPRAERESEARQAIAAGPLQLQSGALRVAVSEQNTLKRRLLYARLLPWDEMRALVDPHLHDSDAEIRTAALESLIRAVIYHRGRLAEALAVISERRAEQDAARRTMFVALNGLPQSVWRAEHLPLLAEIIRHGLNDVGLSPQTLNEVMALLLKLMSAHHEWAARQLAMALRERGWREPETATVLRGGAWIEIGMTVELTPVAELHLARELLPQIEQWVAREMDDMDDMALSAMTALFKRSVAFALALPVLEQIVRRTSDKGRAEKALALIAERAHGRLGDLIPQLLADDASWITFPVIMSWLLRHRQDLLTPYLDLRPVAGRWGTGRAPFLLPLPQPFGGGTAAQQERLAQAALTRIADETQNIYAITAAVELLPLLPAIAPSHITPLADDSRSVVRTTALFALARLDASAAATPTLIAALQDSRARIAIQALRSNLRRMPVAEALAVLRSVPFERVTVAKEIVRLVSELDDPAAWEQLVAYTRQDLHRDVRVALLLALDRHLGRPQAWELLEEAARNPDATIALATMRLSSLDLYSFAAKSSRETQQRVLRLAATLLDHPEYAVRKQCEISCGSLDIGDYAHIVTPRLFARVYTGMDTNATQQDHEEGINAIQALFGVCVPDDAETIAAMLRALLPHRYALTTAINKFVYTGNFTERGLLPVLRAALAVLAEDPLVTPQWIELAMRWLPLDEHAAFLLGLAGRAGFQANALPRAATAMTRRRHTDEELEALELALASSNDPQVRWLAFKALEARVEQTKEWTEALRARLDVYRNDPAPLVASEAQFHFTDHDTF